MTFLPTQFCPVHCVRLYCQPGPSICLPLQPTCALNWVPFDGHRQGFPCLLGAPPPNRCLSLFEAGQVVRCPELHMAPKRYNEVSCDETGRPPAFRGHICWFHLGHSPLFHLQVVDPYPWCPLSQSLELVRQEIILKRLLELS